MMAAYDLYGIAATTIEEARAIVSQLLSISFEERDSSYHRGPYYCHGKLGEENIEVKANVDPYEDEPNEVDFPDQKFLLYINNTNRSAELRAALTGKSSVVALLRQENFE